MNRVSHDGFHRTSKVKPVIHLRDLTLCGFSILFGLIVTGIAKLLNRSGEVIGVLSREDLLIAP